MGYRADLGIIDDPVAGREEADSEREREKVWEWYKADFYSRLKPGAAIVLIMQRWHEDDLAGRILRDAGKGGEHWDVLSLPMEAEENDPLGRDPGELLWPEWYKLEQIDQAKRDPRTWLALYQQKPRPQGGGDFRREWLAHYKNKPTEGLNKYIIVDPANSKRKGSDYTAAVVIGLAPDLNYYILDFYRDRFNLTERTELLFRLHREHMPLAVGYEQYGMQADIEHIQDVQEREHYRFRITPLKGSQAKEDRIRRLVPLFEAGRIWFPERLHRTDTQGVTRDLVSTFIEEEYLPFPVGVHDDLMDAVARIVDQDLTAAFPKQMVNYTTALDIRPYRPTEPSTAWMA
jgi:predicted phage terminase large subunit-like protein